MSVNYVILKEWCMQNERGGSYCLVLLKYVSFPRVVIFMQRLLLFFIMLKRTVINCQMNFSTHCILAPNHRIMNILKN